jgi:uncharacterized membrane protein YbhN (UPF0104 family)
VAKHSSLLRTVRKSVSLILVLAFVAWGAVYLYQHPENLTALGNISAGSLVALAWLALLKLATMGMFTWINLDALGVRLGFWEWYGLSAMTAMGNYLIAFRGGAAIRGVYLKSKYNFPYSLFLSTIASLYLLTFPTNAFLGLLALAGVYLWLGISQPTLMLFLLACVVGPVGFLILIRWVPRFSGRWTSELNLVIEGWKVLTAKPTTVVKLILASVFNSLVTVLMIHSSFHALGIELPLVQSGVLGILYLISAMVPITPAGMGFAEATLVLASGAFGLDSTINILAAGLNRSVMLVVSLLLGPLFTIILSRRSGKPISPFHLQAMTPESSEESRGS